MIYVLALQNFEDQNKSVILKPCFNCAVRICITCTFTFRTLTFYLRINLTLKDRFKFCITNTALLANSGHILINKILIRNAFDSYTNVFNQKRAHCLCMSTKFIPFEKTKIVCIVYSASNIIAQLLFKTTAQEHLLLRLLE